MIEDLVIGMAGSGGDGIVSAGESLITASVEEGYYAIMTKSFGSQIRGGESSCRVRISTRPLQSSGGVLDVAVALNWDDFKRFGAELRVDGRTLVIYECGATGVMEKLPIDGTPAEVVAVRIAEIAKPFGEKSKNMVILGLLAGWFGLGRQAILDGIRRKLAKKGGEVLASAENAFAAGINYATANPLRTAREMAKGSAKGLLLSDGNDICAAASIFAGCKFFGGYPITPSSEIMQYLSREIWKYGGVVLQAEDEIAGIGAAVGASFAGVKSMTATSGPGMSLKTEIMGLATIAELPLVIVNVQRGGPATGIPTKAEQSDLFQACFSAHGDVLRPVLAPTCVADTFATTVEAFNLAEHYQSPVVVLSDQELAQRKEAFAPIDLGQFKIEERRRPNDAELQNYVRFKLNESSISPISHPGVKGGAYLASGIEHNEAGSPASGGEMHRKMLQKRFAKFRSLHQRRDLFMIDGDEKSKIGLIGWGSSAGACREARGMAEKRGLNVRVLIPRLVFPVVESIYEEFLAGLQAGLVVEQSYSAQFYRLLRMYVDVVPTIESLAQAGANPICAEQVLARIEQMAKRLGVKKQSDCVMAR